MTTEHATTTDWIHLVQAEYREMPGLQLTKAQMRRLWGLERHTCDAVLEQLQAMHFSADGGHPRFGRVRL
jgi:hypothetical protein